MSKKAIGKYLLTCLIITIFIVVGAISVRAADNVAGLIVSPPTTEKDVAAGSVVTGTVKITNPNASTDLSVAINVEDFAASGEEGGQTFTDPETNTSSFSLGKWISTESTVELKANESKEVSYSVTVPENAEPGGHYGVIFFSPSIKKVEGVTGSGVVAVPKVGALLLLNVPGDIKYSGSIMEFFADKKIYLERDNLVQLVTRFQNLGSNHVKPSGNIVIKNIFGKEVASLAVNEKTGNVLPDSVRKFTNEWQKKWGFGPYKAQLDLKFGESGTASANLSFWIIPWKETLIAFIILLLLIWALRHLKWNTKKQPPVQTNTAPPVNTPPTNTPTNGGNIQG